MKIITVDPNSCVGCGNCEYACAFKQKEDFDKKDSNIRVNFYPEDVVCIPWTCLHCSDAWCMEVCPAGAIKKNPKTNAIEIDSKHCVGCKMCMLACPYGSIHFDTNAMVSRKCDLCQGDPQCVKFCISGALQFVDVEEAFNFKREAFDSQLKHVMNLGKTDKE